MKINELFVKPIDRPINGVIKADQNDEESVWQELDEYVATKQVTEYLRRFFDAYLATVDQPNDPTITARMGVWVAGFFGSGKSHFIKILSYLLSNREATRPSDGAGRSAAQFFESKIADPLLLGDVRRAVASKTDVILFNIDSKADAKSDRDAILQVFLRVFNEMQGLSGDAPHVAHMERYLITKGSYEIFQEAFKASNGNDWVAERDAVDFLRDDVVAGLSKALKMSLESAGQWFDKARDTYRINIEGFAELVRAYLDGKDPGHRIVFLIDEVGQFIGKSTQLMLNLQTITEELGTLCQGRAWVIVTSQEDIDATLGEVNQSRTNDFSKITARFHTRLSLSSSNTDEVISERLLKKTKDAKDELMAVWKAKGDIINNQLAFGDHAVAFRRFKDAEDFAAHYPFAPYQFQLLQKVFESIRKVGATGRHLARGERSMLDAFQTAAVDNGDKGTDALVPLYDFYPSIESFLDSSVKRAIDHAGENPALEEWDTKLLRVLFLIRYIEDIKATVDNLATLCLDRVDADKLTLKRQIQDSLARLEHQNLVRRNGDLWFFLTNEERDVSREIKSVDISWAEIARLVSELVFDEVLRGQTKVRHRETKFDYEFNRLLDGAPWRQANQQLTFEVLSPVGSDYDLMTEARCIGRSFEGMGRAILRMANDSRVDVELRTYLQIEKYIGPKNDTATASLKTILYGRKDENRERRARILTQLSDLMSRGDFYVLGQKLQLKPLGPLALLDELLNYLVSNTYTKLSYIKVRQNDPAAEIRAVLAADTAGQQKIALGGEAGNALAIDEMRQYLTAAAGTSRVLLSDVVDRFAGAPWGWRPEMVTVLLIARLFMAGEIKLVMEGSDLDPKTAAEPLTKPARFKQVSILKRKTADSATRARARGLHREIFSLQPPEDEDGLVAAFRENLGKRKIDLDQARFKAEQRYYPGAAEIAKALAAIERQLAIPDPYEFLSAMLANSDKWLALADETHDVLSFYQTQATVWQRMLDSLASFADNREALLAKGLESAWTLSELEGIRSNPAPYRHINRIDGLVSSVEKVNEALASERREKALLSIDAKIKEANEALDAAPAEATLRHAALKPLLDLKNELAGLLSIPRILYLEGRGGELLDETMGRIAVASRAAVKPPLPLTGTGGSAGVSPVPPLARVPEAKPIRVVRLADLAAKTYLETEREVEDYIAKLRAELLQAIASGYRVRIQ